MADYSPFRCGMCGADFQPEFICQNVKCLPNNIFEPCEEESGYFVILCPACKIKMDEDDRLSMVHKHSE